MQNIPEDEETTSLNIPKTKSAKQMSKINNNRYLNQNIFNMFLQKRYTECLSLIERCKSDEFKIYTRSLIEKNQYRLEQSLQFLNECLIMNRLNYSYLKSISKNYYLLGKYKSSLQVAKDAYKLNSMDYEIFYILGKISLALGDKQTALANFKSSVSKEPNEQSYLQQAKICISSQQYIQAIDILKQSINISSENPEAYELMGLCCNKMGKNEFAFNYYRQALEVDAQRYNSLMGMGAITLDRGDIEEALDIFKRAYKTSSNSAALWNNIGIAMNQKNKYVVAYCCFKRALFLDPFRWDIHANISLIFMNKKKYLPAQIHLRSALKYNRDATLFNLLGVCLCELKDYQNAEKSFEQATRMEQTNSDQFQFNLLICYTKRGSREKAIELYTKLNRTCNNSGVRDKLLTLKTTLEQH